jgi:positive regulator of sigma E activity
MGYFRILGAIPGFFLSSLFLMLLLNVIASRLGISVDINYVTAMLINITLWIAIAPLAAALAKKRFFDWH